MVHACLDMKAVILGKYHYVLYFLVLAMQVSNLIALWFYMMVEVGCNVITLSGIDLMNDI